MTTSKVGKHTKKHGIDNQTKLQRIYSVLIKTKREREKKTPRNSRNL